MTTKKHDIELETIEDDHDHPPYLFAEIVTGDKEERYPEVDFSVCGMDDLRAFKLLSQLAATVYDKMSPDEQISADEWIDALLDDEEDD